MGVKASGGAGDSASADWIERHLFSQGYQIERQALDAPTIQYDQCVLEIGATQIPLLGPPLAKMTGPAGLRAPLTLVRPGESLPALAGTIAVVILPYARHSSLVGPAFRAVITAIETAKAAALLFVTTGPTGEAVALNCSAEHMAAQIPYAIVAPKAFAAGQFKPGVTARLILDGKAMRRSAANIIGRRVAGPEWIAISTPRSGWFHCAAERGPGIALFRHLTTWIAQRFPDKSIFATANSLHEFENAGSARALSVAPKPSETKLWVHLGAGFAARDFHESAASPLRPLKSVDPQRYLGATPDLVTPLSDIFAGHPGLEVPYNATLGTAGELTEIGKAGYQHYFGFFGSHRFHHTTSDRLDKTDPKFVADLVDPIKRAIISAVKS
jgi:hypothetical protein